MIAQNNDPELPDSLGDYGGGVSAKRVRMEHTRMIERALREQWPIPDEFREPVVKRQVRIAIDPESSPREATSAARCLVSMQQQNQEAILKAIDKLVPDQHEVTHRADELQDALDKVRQDADYGRLRRAAAVGHHTQPRLNGANGKHGPMADGQAPRDGG